MSLSTAALFLLLLKAAPVGGGTLSPDGGSAGGSVPRKVQIQSDRFQGALKTKVGVYTGHVKVRRDTTTLTCDKMTVYYLEGADQVARVVCEGHVEALDKGTWVSGEHADFDNMKGLLVMTGNPRARQGNNTTQAERVLYDTERELLKLEGRVESVFEGSALKGAPDSGNGSRSDAGTARK